MITKMMKAGSGNGICTHDDGGHVVVWDAAIRDRWQAFVNANEDARLALVRRGGHPNCLEYLVRPHPACKHERLASYGFPVLDHWQTILTPGGPVIVSQPYDAKVSHAKRSLRDALDRLSLVIVDGGTDRSWYFPNAASLVLIGTPTAVAEVNLEYDVSHCAPIPAGCRAEVLRETVNARGGES